MPIHCPVQINCLEAAAFEALDYRVMGHAYARQNELGLKVFTTQQNFVESHLRRLPVLTNFKAIQWINLNYAQIEFTTLHAKAGE